MTMTDPIRILFVSDVHFGCNSVSQEELANAFAATIFPLLEETDIFFINGDFFDTLVIFDNHGFDPICDTIFKLFYLCEKHNVILRLMQGTWTHDRDQCRRFETFYRYSRATFNFRFVDGIDLEVMSVKDRDLKGMYVPDDLPFKSSDDIVDVIKERLRERGWDSVDYGCMHGFFDFTFPKNVRTDNVVVFKKEQFPFVKKMIDVGHVHQYRKDGHVISNGSFDRLTHGDEDPKGCIKVLDYPDHYTAQFIQNHQAAIFDTLTFVSEDSTETISQKIESHIAGLNTDRTISLRFLVDSSEQYEVVKTWMREHHPNIRCSRKKKSDKDEQQMMIPPSSLIAPVEKIIAPTRKTISSFIRAYIPEDYTLSIEDIEVYLEPTASL
jgi:hypothetical protein